MSIINQLRAFAACLIIVMAIILTVVYVFSLIIYAFVLIDVIKHWH